LPKAERRKRLDGSQRVKLGIVFGKMNLMNMINKILWTVILILSVLIISSFSKDESSQIYKTFSDYRLSYAAEGISYTIDTATEMTLLKNKKFDRITLKDIEVTNPDFIRSEIKKTDRTYLTPIPMFYAITFNEEVYINTKVIHIDTDRSFGEFYLWKFDTYVKVLHIGKYLYFETATPSKGNITGPPTIPGGNIPSFPIHSLVIKPNSSAINIFDGKKGFLVNLNSIDGKAYVVDKDLIEKMLKSDPSLLNQYENDSRKASLEKFRDYAIKYSENNKSTLLSNEEYQLKLKMAETEEKDK
jgi:hypothetical protein